MKDRPVPRTSRYLAIVFLAAMVLAVYWQAGGHSFVDLDDGIYVTRNPMVLKGLTGEGLLWAFTSFHAGNWHPLTWLSHMLDVELFGPSPGWHHRMNVLFHLLNTELLFLVLCRMTGGLWQSALVAALFGTHPLHVESVAWVSERKDVLSTLFWILTMWAYLGYVRRPGIRRYLPLLILFPMGLMCKPMLVTLPFVLLLLDFWPLERMATPETPSFPWQRSFPRVFLRRALEKAPLLALSVPSSILTYMAQTGGRAVSTFEHLPLGSRVANAFVSYVAYIGKTVWPSSLAVFYPHPAFLNAEIPTWKISGSVLLVCGFSVVVLLGARRRPHLAVGWLWYLGTLVPVIGIVQVGAQALADRYTYVPLIGIFIAMAWSLPEIPKSWRSRDSIPWGIALVSVIASTWASHVQVRYWRDSTALLLRAAAVTDKNCFTMNNLGVYHYRSGRFDNAISSYREALRIRPEYSRPWNNLGVCYTELGLHQEAIAHFREAVRLDPGYAEAWYNLGLSSDRLGQHRHAIGYFREALRIHPGYAKAWNGLGAAHHRNGQYQEAVRCFRESLRIQPESADVWYNLGATYATLGLDRQAVSSFQEALRIRPDYPDARNGLAAAGGVPGR